MDKPTISPVADLATWIVPPCAVGKVAGFDAVKITARKVHLIRDNTVILSRFYKAKDKVGHMDFFELVVFVPEEFACRLFPEGSCALGIVISDSIS